MRNEWHFRAPSGAPKLFKAKAHEELLKRSWPNKKALTEIAQLDEKSNMSIIALLRSFFANGFVAFSRS
jgi:hypothetical protein